MSISPNGITALVIEDVPLPPTFQSRFDATAAPPKAITHQCIQLPHGEAQAMILSFGKDIRWLYTYLTADDAQLKSAKLQVPFGDRIETLADDRIPFEFSLPLMPADNPAIQLRFEARTATDEVVKSESVQLGESSTE